MMVVLLVCYDTYIRFIFGPNDFDGCTFTSICPSVGLSEQFSLETHLMISPQNVSFLISAGAKRREIWIFHPIFKK